MGRQSIGVCSLGCGRFFHCIIKTSVERDGERGGDLFRVAYTRRDTDRVERTVQFDPYWNNDDHSRCHFRVFYRKIRNRIGQLARFILDFIVFTDYLEKVLSIDIVCRHNPSCDGTKLLDEERRRVARATCCPCFFTCNVTWVINSPSHIQ